MQSNIQIRYEIEKTILLYGVIRGLRFLIVKYSALVQNHNANTVDRRAFKKTSLTWNRDPIAASPFSRRRIQF